MMSRLTPALQAQATKLAGELATFQAARRLRGLDETQLAARERELTDREGRLGSVRAAARDVAGAREPVGSRG